MDEHVQQMVGERRRALGGIALTADTWGLALSGGGIRSATFCFGLLHALARKGKALDCSLLRFDLMSTVSGGGYIGAMLGRLLQRSADTAQVRQMVAALAEGNTTWFSWWLRANGRYLLPRGFKDRLYALAIYLRNFIGIHVELGIAGLILGGFLAAFNLLGWQAMYSFVNQVGFSRLAPLREVLAWLPTLWVLLPLLASAALVVILAYWLVPLMVQGMRLLMGFGVAALTLVLLWKFESAWMGSAAAAGYLARQWMWYGAVSIASAWLAAPWIVAAMYLRQDGRGTGTVSTTRSWRDVASGTARHLLTEQRTRLEQDQARHQATSALAWLLRAMAVIAMLGVLDRAAWWLAFEFRAWADTGLLLATAALCLRALLPLVSKLQAGKAGIAPLLTLADLLGRLLTFCLFTWWVAVVHLAALGALFDGSGQPDLGAALLPTLVILIGAIAYATLTGLNVEFLNLSSLHGFYRSRLVRSYLGASNPKRFFGDRTSPPLGAAASLPADPQGHTIKDVADVDDDDDLPINAYRPHIHGGPVHLINVCLNETRDPRGGLFNRDRKGRPLVVAPGGLLRVGQQPWRSLQNGERSLTLGSWTAISGAAMSPALGRMTRGGIASLAMFAGARLGFWFDSTVLDGHDATLKGKRWLPAPAKLLGVLNEARGVFAGLQRRDWYLTDGGHFENTGAYALLAERCKVIVLADCGADPDYRFRDLENLVRKARIDLRAEIDFLRPKPHDWVPAQADAKPPQLLQFFGSLNDLHSDKSAARYALARVIYLDEDPVEKQALHIGYLVVVKPNMFAGLPVDLVNFKAENHAFPQQSTADQFFDEAQWESHFKLGKEMGRLLTIDAITHLTEQAQAWFVKDDGTPIDEPGDAAANAAPGHRSGQPLGEGRLPARLGTPAVAALGLGAAATVGVAVWQAIDSVRKSFDDRVREERMVLKELTDLQAKLPNETVANAKPGEAALAAGAMAAVVNRLSDTLCPSNDAGWFRRSALAVDVIDSARYACEAYGAGSMACNRMLNALDPFATHTTASCLSTGVALAQRYDDEDGGDGGCTPYWAWDYRSAALPRCAHPDDDNAKARRAEFRQRRDQYVVIPMGMLPPDPPPANLPCSGTTVLPMVYANHDAPYVRHLATYLRSWHQRGAQVKDTEDLLTKAAVYRRTPPVIPAVTLLRYNESVPRECVDQLVRIASQSKPEDKAALDLRSWRIERATALSPVRAGGIEVRLVPPPSKKQDPPKPEPEQNPLPLVSNLVVLTLPSPQCTPHCLPATSSACGPSRRKRVTPIPSGTSKRAMADCPGVHLGEERPVVGRDDVRLPSSSEPLVSTPR